jgi:hypothetical protein
MFKIAQFCAAELALGKQLAAFEALKNDPDLKRELAFDGELEDLLSKYSMTKEALRTFLSMQHAAANRAGSKPASAIASSSSSSGGGSKKSPRGNVKLYTNPHTGEKVESARRDHSTLKQWAAEHGLEAVISWAQ